METQNLLTIREATPMSSRAIGRLVSISAESVIGELYEDLGTYVNTADGTRFVGEVGSYVTINEIGRTVVAEIISVADKALFTQEHDARARDTRQVVLSLEGEIRGNNFTFGVSRMPQIYAEISLISERDFDAMLKVDSAEEPVVAQTPESDKNGEQATRALQFPLGKSVIFPDYDVNIDIDRFFGGHFAVFGNTGAGKSNTVARTIQTIFEKKNFSACGARFVILDSNGEYSKAFSKLSSSNREISVRELSVDPTPNTESFRIPVWALTADDWAILLHASEKTQVPVLRRAIHIARLFYGEEGNDEARNYITATAILGILGGADTSPTKIDKALTLLQHFGRGELASGAKKEQELRGYLKNNYGQMTNATAAAKMLESIRSVGAPSESKMKTPIPYSLEQFYDAVNFAVAYEGGMSTPRIQEYTATLLTRLQGLIEGIAGSFLDKTNFTTLDEYLVDLLGQAQVINVDISGMDDASGQVIAEVLAKLLFDHLKAAPNKAETPINFIVEEAHRYIKPQQDYGAIGYDVFEKIAKEGRKYGLLLGISSQRPSELSSTVVSQCSNFIVHRVQNPEDLRYISRMVPYVNRSIIERLTYLQTGTALVFGTAINLPTLVQVPIASPTTDSANASISEKWYVSPDVARCRMGAGNA